MRDLWQHLVLFNFGPETRVPAVYLNADKGRDIASFAKAMKDLHDAGLPSLGAKWVRGEIGAPEPQEDEELMIPIDFVDTEGEPTDGKDPPDPMTNKRQKKPKATKE
jgi:phage gp29-like protein